VSSGTLADAAARAAELAEAGEVRALADLRTEWDEEIESAARDQDYRVRAQAFRAVGQFRFRQKLQLLRRGLEDESPACRGSALVSLELLTRDAPGGINAVRPLLHRLVSADDNQAVRRLAVVCLRNGSPSRDTLVLLNGLADDDEADRDLRDVSRKVAAALKKKSDTRQ
jgi:HEAT repeat protein